MLNWEAKFDNKQTKWKWKENTNNFHQLWITGNKILNRKQEIDKCNYCYINYMLFYKQSFSSTQFYCCSISWIEIQMLLSYCLIYIPHFDIPQKWDPGPGTSAVGTPKCLGGTWNLGSPKWDLGPRTSKYSSGPKTQDPQSETRNPGPRK